MECTLGSLDEGVDGSKSCPQTEAVTSSHVAPPNALLGLNKTQR